MTMTGEPHESKGFDSHKIEMSYSPICRTNEAPQIKKDRVDMCDDKINMSDYVRVSTSKEAGKRASKILKNKIHNKFSDVLFRHRQF